MKIVCPKCKSPWEPRSTPKDGERLPCPHCGAVLRIKQLRPPTGKSPTAKGRDKALQETVFDTEIHEAETLADPGQHGNDDFDASSTHVAPGEPDGGQAVQRKSTKRRNRVAREMEHLSGKTLAGYEMHEMLGAGGMGAVFRARQISLDRNVAVKVLPERLARNAEALARFTREALSAGQLNHPNVVQVYDVISSDGYHFIPMEYVPGLSLGQMVHLNGVFSWRAAAGLVLQAARGLAYAHDLNIIHRDIKPDNLLMSEHGNVKIADMGLAKSIHDLDVENADGEADERSQQDDSPSPSNLTGTKKGLGTPAYMPPEQATQAAHVDGRADQYALGCTLFFLCTGQPPYRAEKPLEFIEKHRDEAIPHLSLLLPDVPNALQDILERMLAKSPDDRYPDMHQLITALEEFLEIDSEEGEQGALRRRDLEALETAQAAYIAAPFSRLAQWLKMAGTSLFFLICAALLLTAHWADAFLFGVFGLSTCGSAFFLHGLLTGDYLFRRLRHIYLDRPFRVWASQSVLLVALAMLAMLLFPNLALAALGGGGLGALYELLICRLVRRRRLMPVEQAESHLRQMRLRGFSEEDLQDFVARFGSRNWESFFEDIFGYEALLSTHERLEHREDHRHRFHPIALWRSEVIEQLEKIERKRRALREKKILEKSEKRRLRAQGLGKSEAGRQAREQARTFKRDQAQRRKPVEKTRHKKTRHTERISKRPAWKSFLPEISLAGLAWSMVRALAGLVLTGLGCWPFIDPGVSSSWRAFYYHMGNPQPLFVAAAGVALLLTAFSRQLLGPLLILAGSVLVVGHMQLDAWTLTISRLLTAGMLFLVGLTLVASGFILTLLGRSKT